MTDDKNDNKNDKNIDFSGMKTSEKILCGIIILFTLMGVILQVIPGMKFSGRLFLCLAVGCIGWIYLNRWAENDKNGRICKNIVIKILCVGLFLFLILEGVIIRRGNQDWSKIPADAVIILGAGVNGERPSLVLQSRINRAWEYAQDNPDVLLILSGGQGEGEYITEAEAMRRALAARGADESKILLEDKSKSTYENFIFSRDILLKNGIDIDAANIIFITNNFHVFRAGFIARRLGLQMIGLPAAEIPWWLNINYYIREPFALVKTILLDR